MSRQSRINALGVLHHLIIRGIERTATFRDDKNLEDFLGRITELLLEYFTPFTGERR